MTLWAYDIILNRQIMQFIALDIVWSSIFETGNILHLFEYVSEEYEELTWLFVVYSKQIVIIAAVNILFKIIKLKW